MSRASSFGWDITLSISVFVLASMAAGRIYRWPFDDEVYTLELISQYPIRALAVLLQNGLDVHPSLSYLLFSSGSYLGMNADQLRWLSLACTAGGLGTWHYLTLDAISDEAAPSASVRLLMALMFGLQPMALSQGDALRWYPLLTLLSSLSFYIYLKAGNYWYLCAIPLGLAAETEFLAILVFLAIAADRYFERKIDRRSDVVFLMLTGLIALPAIVTFVDIVRLHGLSEQLAPGIGRRVLETSLGFFGGTTLGISQSWIVIGGAAATTYFLRQALVFSRIHPKARTILRLASVVAAGMILLTLIVGLSEPRAFLFFTPMLTSAIAMGFGAAMRSSPERSSFAYALILITSLFVIGNLRRTTTPFKRNSAIPFGEIEDFVRTNQRGRTVILTSDSSVAYSLAKDGFCADLFEPWDHRWRHPRCWDGESFDTLIIVKGKPLDEHDPQWEKELGSLVASRDVVAKAHFGYDDDAFIKDRLTNSHLVPAILEADIYR